MSLTDSLSIITYFPPVVYKFPIFISKDQCYITVSIQDNYPSISVFISSTLSSFCFLPTTMHWATFLSSLSVEALPLQSQTHLSFLIFSTGISCLLYWLNGVKNRIKTHQVKVPVNCCVTSHLSATLGLSSHFCKRHQPEGPTESISSHLGEYSAVHLPQLLSWDHWQN